LANSENVFQFRSSTVLWHKENLLNVLVGKLPPGIKKIVWADCDLTFSAPDWWKRASEMLEDKIAIQPFETAVWHNPDGVSSYQTKKSFVHYVVHEAPGPNERVDWPKCHPG